MLISPILLRFILYSGDSKAPLSSGLLLILGKFYYFILLLLIICTVLFVSFIVQSLGANLHMFHTTRIGNQVNFYYIIEKYLKIINNNFYYYYRFEQQLYQWCLERVCELVHQEDLNLLLEKFLIFNQLILTNLLLSYNCSIMYTFLI